MKVKSFTMHGDCDRNTVKTCVETVDGQIFEHLVNDPVLLRAYAAALLANLLVVQLAEAVDIGDGSCELTTHQQPN